MKKKQKLLRKKDESASLAETAGSARQDADLMETDRETGKNYHIRSGKLAALNTEAKSMREKGKDAWTRLAGSQSGFWRSPTGENHGRDSRPGDVWCSPGDIHDIDRMNFLEQDKSNFWFIVGGQCELGTSKGELKADTLRAAIDAAILSSSNQ